MLKKITRYAPWITLLVCGLLITTVVVAQPGGWGGGPGGRQGQGQGMGPGQGFGPGGGHDQMGMFFGPEGPFGNQEIRELMSEIRILGFIDRFEFTSDQLKEIAALSEDTRGIMDDITGEITDKMIDRLTERRDALLKGEKPDKFERPEKTEISDEQKEEFKKAHEAIKANIDAFLDILTDDQKAMMKKGMDHQGFGRDGQDRQGKQGRRENRKDNRMQGRGGFQGRPGGPRGGFQGGPGGPEMDGHMMILNILLDPATSDVIDMKLKYM